ncbi:MAG: YHS domain-containing protein [Anaerolineae bacterium]
MTARDPVCGMPVDTKTATHRSEYRGQTYYFCSQGCKVAFDKEPEKYAAQQKSASKK